MDDGQEPTDVGARQAEIESEVAAAGEAARQAAAHHGQRLQERLDSLEKRGRDAIAQRTAQQERAEARSFTAGGLGRGTGIGLSVAYALLGLPMVGFGLGWLADRGTDSNVFGLVGFCLGGAAGIWFAVHQMKRL